MEDQINFKCNDHPDKYDCPDCLISYIPKYDEYGIIIHDGGSSILTISYCPFCGQKLPESKRSLWFEKLESLGFDDPLSEENIPEEFTDDRWYR